MLKLKKETRLYMAAASVDMRKSIDGLSILAQENLKQEAQSGHLFIFYNGRRNKIKCLFWDRNGFVLYYKRLDKGRFKIPKNLVGEGVVLEQEQLDWLLAGLDFQQVIHYPELRAKYLF